MRDGLNDVTVLPLTDGAEIYWEVLDSSVFKFYYMQHRLVSYMETGAEIIG